MAMYFDEGDQPQPLSSTVPGIAPVAPPMMQNMGAYQQQGDLYRQFLHPYGGMQQQQTPDQQMGQYQQYLQQQQSNQANQGGPMQTTQMPQFMTTGQSGNMLSAAPQQSVMANPYQQAMQQQSLDARNTYQQQGPMPALQSAFTQPPVASGGIGSLNQSQPPSSLSQTSNSNQGASASEPVNLGAKMAGPNGAMTGSGNQQQSRVVGGNGVM